MTSKQAVWDETRRRIAQAMDCRPGADMALKGVNLLIDATLSPDEAHIGTLAHIQVIRSAGQALEETLPDDIEDDRHWPSRPSVMGFTAERQLVAPGRPVDSFSSEAAERRLADLERRLSAVQEDLRKDSERFRIELDQVRRETEQRIEAAASAHQPSASAVPADDVEMPAFLRRAAATAGSVPIASVLRPDMDHVIGIMNDIERAFVGRLDELTSRVEEIARRLDMPAAPASDIDNQDALRALESWLQSIDQRARHADQLATALAAQQADRLGCVDPAAAPLSSGGDANVPVLGPRETALDRIKVAARKRRDDLIGASADDRDVRQRLTEVSLNAGSGHQASMDALGKLAQSYGMGLDALRQEIIRQHDLATVVTVDTTAIESAAAIRLAGAQLDEMEAIADDAVAAIRRVTS